MTTQQHTQPTVQEVEQTQQVQHPLQTKRQSSQTPHHHVQHPQHQPLAHELIAKRLSELGNPTRLCIVRQLIKAGDCGLSMGDIQTKLGGIPCSTLSHHVSRLMHAGLVKQRRAGCTLYCYTIPSALQDVICYLQSECCRQDNLNPHNSTQ